VELKADREDLDDFERARHERVAKRAAVYNSAEHLDATPNAHLITTPVDYNQLARPKLTKEERIGIAKPPI